MTDPTLRNYAQQENDHVLSLLLQSSHGERHENPEEVAERNCGATERSFGQTDPLHAMALNTFAFVLLHTDQDPETARDSAMKAFEILRDRDDEQEMRLESQCLVALATTKAGAAPSSAIQDTFRLSSGAAGPPASPTSAKRSFADILTRSVREPGLTRIPLTLAMREIGERLLAEVDENGDPTVQQSFMAAHLAFLETYYGRSGEEE